MLDNSYTGLVDAPETTANESQPGFSVELKLDALEKLILNSTHVPLTELMLIDRAAFLYQLNQVKENLPIDLVTAVEIAQHEQQIIAEAEHYADSVVKSAQEKAERILRNSTILRQAELDGAKIRLKTERECEHLKQATLDEITQIRQDAIAQSQAIQAGADEYADNVLGDIETKLQQMLAIIRNGRQQLEGTSTDEHK